MTQNESFPGRPRGRRARQDNGESEWQGHDAAPTGPREFPDLAPVRPPESRTRDGRGLPGQPARPGQPAAYGSHQGAVGYLGGRQVQVGDYHRPGQAPWPDQPAPQFQAPAQQASRRQVKESRQQVKEQRRKKEDETPSWAVPDSVEEFSERWRRRGREARQEEQQAGQRKRRRLLITGGVVAAIAIAVAVDLLSGGPGAANLGFGNFVTNFLPGELQQVPNPCTAVPTATLNQYLPGKTQEAAPPLNSGTDTECTWTLDKAPTYRVLTVQLQAYSPSGLASGDGSATFAAEDAYQSFENGFAKPGPKSAQPPATVTNLSGMPGGTQTSAFQATEVSSKGGANLDMANVLVRYRNVIITVVVDGLNQSSGGKTYATSMSDLTAAANGVAKQMASQIAK